MKKIIPLKLGNISVALSSRIGHVVNNNGCKESSCGLGSRLESSCSNPLVCQVLSSTQLKHMSSSVGMVLPNWMESHKSHVPNHQPDYVIGSYGNWCISTWTHRNHISRSKSSESSLQILRNHGAGAMATSHHNSPLRSTFTGLVFWKSEPETIDFPMK